MGAGRKQGRGRCHGRVDLPVDARAARPARAVRGRALARSPARRRDLWCSSHGNAVSRAACGPTEADCRRCAARPRTWRPTGARTPWPRSCPCYGSCSVPGRRTTGTCSRSGTPREPCCGSRVTPGPSHAPRGCTSRKEPGGPRGQAGTNAPGTALELGHPVQIVNGEHYNSAAHAWSCAAAPVRDPATGPLLGVVDLTGGSTIATPRALAAVRAAALAAEAELARGLPHRTSCSGPTDER
ncbi:GAF domain-containing protein [Streptomyces sp. NPDC013978]|uniref:GAF domain-containing protein n=1 Tax=Streptomyces sp. NPDC013978 TaxID=3364869 RepID=UPI0036FE409B